MSALSDKSHNWITRNPLNTPNYFAQYSILLGKWITLILHLRMRKNVKETGCC